MTTINLKSKVSLKKDTAHDYIYETFDEKPIKLVSGKKYCINSLTDHAPITRPELLRQIAEEAFRTVNFDDIDFIVGEEDIPCRISCNRPVLVVGKIICL